MPSGGGNKPRKQDAPISNAPIVPNKAKQVVYVIAVIVVLIAIITLVVL